MDESYQIFWKQIGGDSVRHKKPPVRKRGKGVQSDPGHRLEQKRWRKAFERLPVNRSKKNLQQDDTSCGLLCIEFAMIFA